MVEGNEGALARLAATRINKAWQAGGDDRPWWGSPALSSWQVGSGGGSFCATVVQQGGKVALLCLQAPAPAPAPTPYEYSNTDSNTVLPMGWAALRLPLLALLVAPATQHRPPPKFPPQLPTTTVQASVASTLRDVPNAFDSIIIWGGKEVEWGVLRRGGDEQREQGQPQRRPAHG